MIIVDSHVHLHSCFDKSTALMAAARNLICSSDGATPLDMAICLTESQGVNAFRELKSMAASGTTLHDWIFKQSPESDSLTASHPEGINIWVFAGRQIVTTDNLEVLCLGRDADIADRSGSTKEIIERVNELGAIAVVPWGFGKWSGVRGGVVRRLLDDSSPRPFYLGDNSGRLRISREPSLFAEARAKGIQVLPGSDPLPFRGQQSVPGRYGLLLEGVLQPDAPFETLKRLIGGSGNDPRCVGHKEGLLRFALNQVRMQIKKRLN